jgi:hypothetical protein
MAEMVIFIDASEAEQRVRLDGVVMDPTSYWKIRLGTSAVGVCSAILEYLEAFICASVLEILTVTDTSPKPHSLPN